MTSLQIKSLWRQSGPILIAGMVAMTMPSSGCLGDCECPDVTDERVQPGTFEVGSTADSYAAVLGGEVVITEDFVTIEYMVGDESVMVTYAVTGEIKI